MNRPLSIVRAMMAVTLGACAASPAAPSPSPASAIPPIASTSAPAAHTPTPGRFPIHDFGPAPSTDLPALEARGLEDVILAAIDERPGLAVTAAVLNGRGTWSIVKKIDVSGQAVEPPASWSTGSIGKTVVATQVLRLVEMGRVDLDTPAAAYLSPEVDANGATVRQLLRMRSGITAHVPPDTRFEYANVDYVLLGQVLEHVEGRPLRDVLTQGVLSMPGAEGLRFPEGGTVENAAGPLQTDALSLARWGRALFGGRLLKPASFAAMTAFDADTYGMGLFDFTEDFHRSAAGHLGVDEPASAMLVVLPEDELVVAVLATPLSWEQTEEIAIRLASATLG